MRRSKIEKTLVHGKGKEKSRRTLSVIYMENLQCSLDYLDAMGVVGGQCLARLANSSHTESYSGKTVLY